MFFNVPAGFLAARSFTVKSPVKGGSSIGMILTTATFYVNSCRNVDDDKNPAAAAIMKDHKLKASCKFYTCSARVIS